MLARFDERAPIDDREGRFFDEDFEELRSSGFLLAAVPVELGGSGRGLDGYSALMRRLGYVAPATALAVNMHRYWTGVVSDLLKIGDESCRWILEKAAEGEVFCGERGRPARKTVVVDVRVDDDPEPLTELRRLAGLSRAYRRYNVPLECIAGGDHVGAVEAARELCARLPDDPNARMRLGLTPATGGDPEGGDILVAMADQSDKWLAYVRALRLRYHIDPKPILDGLRSESRLRPPPF